MSFGPGKAIGSVMDSATDGIFPWDQGNWKSAGQMTDYAMQGAAAGAAVVIVLLIIIVSFLVSVYIRRAVGKDSTVARILWWTLGIFVGCVAIGFLLLKVPGLEPLGWYLGAWAFMALCVIATGCELYSMKFDNFDEIPAEDLDKFLGDFTAAGSPSSNGKKTLVGAGV